MTLSNTAAVLRGLVERIERIEEEKKALSDDQKNVYTEAKLSGFDVKALRKVIARRKLDPEERAELDALMALYEANLGAGPDAGEGALA